jgi:hypothetical protein
MLGLTAYILLVTIKLWGFPSWALEDLMKGVIFTPNFSYVIYGFVFALGTYFINEAALLWFKPQSSL